MAPNPIFIPRQPPATSVPQDRCDPKQTRSNFTISLLATLGVAVLATNFSWAYHWLLSGAAIESLLILYSHEDRNRIFPSIPLWILLTTLNLSYVVCSTSWLLRGLYITTCYPVIPLTSLAQFPAVGDFSRRLMRKILGKYPHFIRDRVGLFDLPALEIDTEVAGLFVVRGLTISFATLTVVAHGLEVGIKLADDIELAIYVDQVTVSLFRHIDIGDVYATVKGGKFEMTFRELQEDINDEDALSVESILLDDTPLLRAATAGSEGFKNRPKLGQSLTGISHIENSSAKAGIDSVTSLSPDDEIADKKYRELLMEIRTTSAIYRSRQQALKRVKAECDLTMDDNKHMRAAICAELHGIPTIAHPPARSIRITTLQNMSPPYVRRFMHRLPLLLRLLLAPLSYFHSIRISSINAAGSGQWVSALLEQKVFKQYVETSSELRKLHRRVSTWLADATFCLQLTNVDGLGQVPLSTGYDIVTYLKFTDVLAYRMVQQSGTLSQVVRLSGADATFTIPSYLLPHHEHLLPPKPTAEDKKQVEIEVVEANETLKTVQAKQRLEIMAEDETKIKMSVHASLPAKFDQSLLNFMAALVKATKIIELEKEVGDATRNNESDPVSPAPTNDSATKITPMFDSDLSASSSLAKANTGAKDFSNFKSITRNIRQNLTDSNATMKEFAKELHQNTRDGMKKAVVGGLVNDRWIAKIIGKTAAVLQKAQGDVGYSGGITIPLAPYRATQDLASKLLP